MTLEEAIKIKKSLQELEATGDCWYLFKSCEKRKSEALTIIRREIRNLKTNHSEVK